MAVIVLNKFIFFISLIFSINTFAVLEICQDDSVVNQFIEGPTVLDPVLNCAKKATKANLGFKKNETSILVLKDKIDNKIFYFSFPMIHEITFFKFRNKELVDKGFYSKVHNTGNEYVYFDNLNSTNNIILAVVKTKSSIQLPYMLFNSQKEFDTFTKKNHLFDGIWFGIITFTFITTLAFFYLRRKSEIVYYSIHIVSIFFIQMAFSGYFFSFMVFLPIYLKHRVVVLALSALSFGTVSLIYKTFSSERPNDKVFKLYQYVAFASLAHIVFSLFHYGQLTIKLTSYLTLLLSISSIIVCLYALAKRLKYSLSFLMSFSFFLFSTLVFTIKDLGILPVNEIEANYLVKISLLIEILILGAVMVRNLFEEAKLITNSSINKMIATSNVQVINQLQHDIQSPLTYLENFFDEIKTKIPEDLRIESRQAFNRVQDIVNGLKVNPSTPIIEESKEKEILCIYPLLKRIISEKRNEHKSLNDIKIDLSYNEHKDLFVDIKKSDFLRAMSNLINNSIEAKKPNGILKIDIDLFERNDKVIILIKDNGTGIPSDKLNSIFEYGVSINKDKGNGLGLFQVKQHINDHNGQISINSDQENGTEILISLPLAPAPQWYQSSFQTMTKNIVIVDDEESIHNLWKEKLAKSDFNISFIKSPSHFEHWANQKGLNGFYFIFDYEFLNEPMNGIDLIKKYDLSKNSTLVTSHFLNSDIQKDCLTNNIKLIPKESILFIQLRFFENRILSHVLIDDDELIHLTWKRHFKNNDLLIDTYYSIDEFLNKSSNYACETPIYIDSNLGDGIKGEIESEKLSLQGFKNLMITTGYDPKSFKKPKWIKQIIGKSPKNVI